MRLELFLSTRWRPCRACGSISSSLSVWFQGKPCAPRNPRISPARPFFHLPKLYLHPRGRPALQVCLYPDKRAQYRPASVHTGAGLLGNCWMKPAGSQLPSPRARLAASGLHTTAKPHPTRLGSVVFWGWTAPSASSFPGQYTETWAPGRGFRQAPHASTAPPATTSGDPSP